MQGTLPPENETKPAAADQADQENTGLKQVEVDGYKFQVDTDLLDDVEAFEIIDRIENKRQVAAIVPLLNFLIGAQAFAEMKAAFSEMDAKAHAKEHPKDTQYKGRFRLSKLNDVYLAIIEKFDPKD